MAAHYCAGSWLTMLVVAQYSKHRTACLLQSNSDVKGLTQTQQLTIHI